MACIKKSVVKWLKDDELFNSFFRNYQITENICLYKWFDCRIALYYSNSKKSLILIFSNDKKNLLKIRIESHFIDRFNERITNFYTKSIIIIIGKIFFKYYGNFIRKYNNKGENIEINYPIFRNRYYLKIIAEEHKSEIVFKTCYKRTAIKENKKNINLLNF